MDIKKYYVFIVTGLIILSSCSDRSIEDLTPPSVTPETINYNNNIANIVQNNCIMCHGIIPQNGAPMSLATYDDLVDAIINRGLNARINDAQNPMPPTGLLPQPTRDLMQEWIDGGFLEN